MDSRKRPKKDNFYSIERCYSSLFAEIVCGEMLVWSFMTISERKTPEVARCKDPEMAMGGKQKKRKSF
jgi:hypothetical protein